MLDSLKALEIISAHRHDEIVISTMTAALEWSAVSSAPDLDLYLSGAMGKASSVGLGLALAKPDKKVLVLDGDGSLLMNLGTLVTIASFAPSNLIHFVIENGLYRSSGGQPIPNAGKFSFTGFAKAAGYPQTFEFDDQEKLARDIKTVVEGNTLTFVCLKVPANAQRPPYPFVKTADVVEKFLAAIGTSSW